MNRMLLAVILLVFSSLAFSSELDECRDVRLADAGWTGNTTNTAVVKELLQEIGYSPEVYILSMPVIYKSQENNDVDVFLANWAPSQNAEIDPYLKRGTVERLTTFLSGAKYTIAVPKYAYDQGVRHYRDIAKFAEKFDRKIYGIDPGSRGNRDVLKMIKINDFGLGEFDLVQSSEAGMLTEVAHAVKNKEWVAFLGWAPHPMNTRFEIEYLAGGDNYFGPNFGQSTVYTTTRKGFQKDCPNLTAFFMNHTFTVDMENELMSMVLLDKLEPKKAAHKFIVAHPEFVKKWYQGVTRYGGTPIGVMPKFNSNDKGQGMFGKIEKMPLGSIMSLGVTFMTSNFSNQLRKFSDFQEDTFQGAVEFLENLPALLTILLLSMFVFVWRRSIKLSAMVLIGLGVILNLGYWPQTVQTVVLVLFATFISVAIGVPVGILSAHSPKFYRAVRPVLDLMQTIPTFVYLIPTLMLFGLGIVPGMISTIIFSLPAPVRLTHLGITSVPKESIEAGTAFGATRWQILRKIEIPYALPSIMAGVTQCIMLSLSMVVVAALVGAEGLGTPVVQALNTVNVEQGFEAGLAIVIVAILLDRVLRNESAGKNLA